MKAFTIHIRALVYMTSSFAKGKFWFHLIPGAATALFLYYLDKGLNFTPTPAENLEGWSATWQSALNSTFYGIHFLIEHLKIFAILTLFSPIYAHLSTKIEEDLSPQAVSISWWSIFFELIRMTGVVILLLLFEWLLSILFGIANWLIDLEVLRPAFYYLLSAYFYGYSFYDYSLERHQIRIFTSIAFAKNKAVYVLLTGILFKSMLMIPFVGVIVAPIFATVLATYVFLALNDMIKK